LKSLIVTADDVGLHPGMTLGALKAHDEGIVTACSVVANGRAFNLAVPPLRDRPGLEVGIHFTLVGERPLSPPERVPSLLGRDGAFLPDFRAFTLRYLTGGIREAEVEEELRRQAERLLATGLPVLHANSHQHLHVLPGIFAVVLRLAEALGIPFLRIPGDLSAVRRPSPRSVQVLVLGLLGRRALWRLEERSAVRTAGGTVGVLDAGRLTPGRLARILEDVEGTAELVCHPGIGDEALQAEYDWGYRWERETAALCDAGVREALASAGVRLTSFSRLRGLFLTS
jgi:chitin disaccharide deacetylase